MAGESTEDLLRMIGRELQGIRHETKRTAGAVVFMAAVTFINVALAALWLFGFVEVEVSGGRPFG